MLEVLTAMAVLALMLALLLKISGGTLGAVRAARQEMNSTQRTRLVLDAIANDLAQVVTQNGAAILVSEDAQTHDGQLVFLTRRRAPTAEADSARWLAVSYQLSNNQIIRSVAVVPWSQTDLFAAALSATKSTSTSVIANDVLRFEFAVILDTPSNGFTCVPISAANEKWLSSKTTTGEAVDPYTALVLSDSTVASANPRARSLIVGVATVDDQAMTILQNTGQLQNFITAIQPGAIQPGQTPSEAWNSAVAAGLGIYPGPALAALRTDQRVYLLK